MKKNKKSTGEKTVLLSIDDIKNLINLVEADKCRIDSSMLNANSVYLPSSRDDPFLIDNKIYAIMYLESIKEKLKRGLK